MVSSLYKESVYRGKNKAQALFFMAKKDEWGRLTEKPKPVLLLSSIQGSYD